MPWTESYWAPAGVAETSAISPNASGSHFQMHSGTLGLPLGQTGKGQQGKCLSQGAMAFPAADGENDEELS